MTIAIVQQAQNSSGVGLSTTISATFAAAPSTGRILVGLTTLQSLANPAVWPAGWTVIQSHNPSGGFPGVSVAIKTAGGSEPATVTVSGPNIDRRALQLFELSGAVYDVSVIGTTPSSTSMALPSITPTGPGPVALIAAFFAFQAQNRTGDPASYTLEQETVPNTGVNSTRCTTYFRAIASPSGSYGGTATYAAAVEAVGVQVSFTEGAPPTGYYLNVYDPADTFLVTLDEAFDVKVRIERNGVGTGKFSVNRHSSEATAAVLTPGNYVRVTVPQIDPDPIFGFFLERGDFKLVSSDEEGGENLTFEGRGSLSYWDRAIWLAESFLVPWWPSYLTGGDVPPPSTAIGAIAFPVGSYYSYTVSGSTVTARTTLHVTNGFTAYYDTRQRYTRSGLPSLTLVHLSTGVHSGLYVNPFATGVRDYRKKSSYTLGPSVLMSNISANQRPGEVLYAMYGESQSSDRPDQPLPALTVDFSATLDSAGNAWTVTDALDGVSAELGDDYLSTIGKLVNTGAIDVVAGPDLDMHAYNAYGRDLHSATFAAGKVRFAKAVNIADELTREYTDQPVGTFAEVIGNEEGAIARVFLPSAGSRPAREISVRGDTTGTAALEALGLSELAARLLHSDAIGFAVATPIDGAEDELTGLYLPGPPGSANGKYWVGDLVTLHTGSGEHDFNETTVRVAAITMSFSDADDLLVVVEVGSGFGGMPQISASSGSSTGPSSGTAVSTLSDLYQLVSERDQIGGYAGLDDDGLISTSQLPASTGVGAILVSDTPSTPLVFADLLQNEDQDDLLYQDA